MYFNKKSHKQKVKKKVKIEQQIKNNPFDPLTEFSVDSDWDEIPDSFTTDTLHELGV